MADARREVDVSDAHVEFIAAANAEHGGKIGFKLAQMLRELRRRLTKAENAERALRQAVELAKPARFQNLTGWTECTECTEWIFARAAEIQAEIEKGKS